MNNSDITKFINITLLRILRVHNTWPEDLIDDETGAPLDYESLIEKATEHLAQHKFLAIVLQQDTPTLILEKFESHQEYLNTYKDDEDKDIDKEYFDKNQLLTLIGNYQLIVIIDP